MKIDLAIVARDLKLPPEKIEKTVELLDEGNTISFITRFRKDLTGGLDEQQILAIKQRVSQLRALAERKAFVLKSIESQGKLSDELKTQINKSTSSRRLEDLYLPFKPKKQSRASVARQQGLEPLAEDIFNASTPDFEIAIRATDYVRVDKGLTSVDDVIKGVGDLIAEKLSENDELRNSLRKIMWSDGKLTSVAIEESTDAKSKDKVAETSKVVAPKDAVPPTAQTDSTAKPIETAKPIVPAEPQVVETQQATLPKAEVTDAAPIPAPLKPIESAATPVSEESPIAPEPIATDPVAPKPIVTDAPTTATSSPETPPAPTATAVETPKPKKKKKKKKKKTGEDPFKDYRDFKQPLKQIPNHRVLAINRGERAGSLKVKIAVEGNKLVETANATLVPAEHPFKEFLTKCAGDALNRMMIPSLEREIRRELTEAAEKHAVEVFANNLRNLLLQPPVRNRVVLAIDPGFKRGCSVAVLDACGNLLDSGHVFVVGNQTRRDESIQKIADWVKQHNVDVIAIGNGAACRQTEQMVSDAIAEKLQDLQTTYAMVNEAGTSIYSTSEIGREEMPDASPSIRSAASIGRRIQDPLSELVKISPANIGVGMYQHDVKAKHLSESLDEVVRFCVNRVGVDVNTASPSLLKYVSGLNSLTARRVVEHRQASGQFKNRAQLKEVNGFGDATFVQSAGFLRIHDGDTPLDCTAIHPESYSIANDVLERIGVPVEAFFPRQVPSQSKPVTHVANNEPVSTPQDESSKPVEPQDDATELKDATETKSEKTSSSVLSENEVATVENEVAPIENVSATQDPAANVEAPIEPLTVAPLVEAPLAEAPPVPDPSSSKSLTSEQRKENLKKISELNVEELAAQHSAGLLLVKDILMALKRPKWDPRDKVSKPIFRRGIIKADDLKPEMQLDGQVVNVVDFGVFVDIGLGESSLVHVSQLSNHFIRDPHRLYAIGDVLKVWVSEIDSERRRVKLTAIRPGSKKVQHRRPRGGASNRSDDNKTRTGGSSDKSTSASASTHKPGKYGGGSKGKPGQRSGQRSYNKSQPPRTHTRRPSKPKEIKPITDKMLKGKEPMRSFSDLAQFVNKKPDESKKKKEGESGSSS